MIAGLEETTGGEIRNRCRGRHPQGAIEPRTSPWSSQSYALYPPSPSSDNMAFSLSIARRPKAEIEQKVKAARKSFGSPELSERKPSQLSGGQRQRVAIGVQSCASPRSPFRRAAF
ncbi:ATP-binding cassette domain-containing protein (plasmid) [Sinorhizobium meliloti]|nr:ATP-binding cassette domain-containing protein [Sinorhizobium meliloti]